MRKKHYLVKTTWDCYDYNNEERRKAKYRMVWFNKNIQLCYTQLINFTSIYAAELISIYELQYSKPFQFDFF